MRRKAIIRKLLKQPSVCIVAQFEPKVKSFQQFFLKTPPVLLNCLGFNAILVGEFFV